MTLPTNGYALGRDEGDAIWFLGTRMTVKTGRAQTDGGVTVIDQECPAGFAPPAHVHHDEDEIFYVLDGRLDVSCGEKAWQVGPRELVLLPKGVPHRFEVAGGQPARLLQITTPAQFEDFAAAVGEPATAPGLPLPAAPDIERLVATAATFGIEILPPAGA